ncbi:hypothetical protein [Mycolicibacter longobardus]|uniref:hypothetical protein n=1 Tax=Mycolicibacter longobardus TaxID=1108812 RepID=UPI001056C106|nr:hypothetical protein [Mycolicibacter longobardus]
MARTRLFDRIPPASTLPRYTDSSYHLLCRAPEPHWTHVRETLEAWYADFPDPNGDLLARFRQDDPRQHESAWWELYVFTLFRRLGYAVEVHPKVDGSSRRPDFLATRNNSSLYIECAALFDSTIAAEEDGEAFLKDCINATRSPDFGFSLRVDRRGTKRPRQTQVTRRLENWLATLDYAAESATSSEGSKPPSQAFEFADWRVTLTALALPEAHRGSNIPPLMIGPASGAFVVTSVESLRKLLSKKSSQCKGVSRPLMIAGGPSSLWDGSNPMQYRRPRLRAPISTD